MSTYIQTEGGTKPGTPWIGQRNITCDICGVRNPDCFVDGATIHGPWANMCPECFKLHGKGLGPGIGQKYCKRS